MAEQVAVELDVGPFGHMLSSGIAGSHGGFSFSFLRDFNADFNNNWTSLQNQQQGMRVLFPHILFRLTVILLLLLILGILTGVSWNLKVVLICTSLISRDNFDSFVSSFEKTLFRFLSPFLNWVFCFLDSVFFFLRYSKY